MIIEPLGDSAFLVSLGERIDGATALHTQEVARRISSAGLPWVVELVPAYASVAVFVDWMQFPMGENTRNCSRILEQLVGRQAGSKTTHSPSEIEIPVCYGGEFGPDLGEVAARAGLDPQEVIRRHSAPRYTVGCIGFTPGFPYLIGLPPALSTPRRSVPRREIAAGSVGIGGGQTGIYPQRSPGGWNIIGRTPLRLFSVESDPPALLKAGDQVRFVPIAAEAFARAEP